ncbi:MAG TPA: phosphoadenylyl-sulfate reductase [Usitatibacter sp.]|nr:phosphoadenylyl-sulfate reductase [Usitatibacter sp.]
MIFPEKLDRARRFLASIEKNHSPSALASSFGAEDMVLLDLIARDGLAIGVFTIDTGRLPRETHALITEVRRHYGIDVEVFTPWPDSVEAYVAEHGVDGFYDGVEQRAACCHVRKVEPLRRALASRRGWITGLRREQSDSRLNVTEAEHDPVHRKWKFSPLTAWTSEEVWTYLRDNHVPYNALHARGYPSIGCEPCTRAVKPGEHPRAGRWWWEREAAAKECGLHAIPIRVAEPA